MVPDIILKLRDLIRNGINTEAEVVYLMVQVRKLIESERLTDFENLKFHSDWVVHSKLSGRKAQEVLKQFDEANVLLRDGIELEDLPSLLRNEIDQLSKLDIFREELDRFLDGHSLPLINSHEEGWTKFLLLYASIIEDCPLEMTAMATRASVEKVTVKLEKAQQLIGKERPYKISWIVQDRNGSSGDISVYITISE